MGDINRLQSFFFRQEHMHFALTVPDTNRLDENFSGTNVPVVDVGIGPFL